MPKFDRLTEFDERSREYPIRTLVADKIRRSYTWSVGVSLDQGDEGACFPAGTLIRMVDGSHRPIEDIKFLDEVVTAEGRVGRVLETMVRWYDGELLNIKLRGHNHFKCTPEHPILTDFGYVSAYKLSKSTTVALTRYNPVGNDFLDCSLLVNDTKAMIRNSIPEIVSKTTDLGRLLGLYAAEGYTDYSKTRWSYGSHETILAQETIDLLKTVFGVTASLSYRPQNVIIITVYGTGWSKLFSGLVLGTAKHGTKRLSEKVANGPADYRRAILQGWLDGDGHRRRTAYEGVSVCHQLGMDMYAIAQDLGLSVTINRSNPSLNKYAKTRQQRWSITLSGIDKRQDPDPLTLVDGFCHCGCGKPTPIASRTRRNDIKGKPTKYLTGHHTPSKGGWPSAKQDSSATWRPVTSIISEPFSGLVYNFEVEGDNSYVAEGFGVHNCVGFGWAHEVAARPKVHPVTNESAFLLYHEAQQLDAWPGEDYEGTSVIAGAKAVQAHGWLGEYRWAFSENDLALAVGYKGPAVLGVNWYSGMDNLISDNQGRLWASVNGYIRGGHCFITHGYSVPLNAYKCWNSWGSPSEFYITATDMAKLLADYGEACIPVQRS